ncbi:MAG: hypothetical protein JWQ63_1138 [Mucilaginibacter sp.]|nr:hypothetical protein [Mucilaginibacter sp.]
MAFAGIAQNAEKEQSVNEVILSFQADFNNGSFKNAATYTTQNWEHINPGGGITKGRNAVLKEVKAVHQTFLKGVTMTIEVISIRFITPDVAIADVVHKISIYEMPKGVKHKNERQRKTYVVVKQNGKWLLTQDQNTIIVQ